MINDYAFASKQFNDSLLTTISSLLNNSFRDSWKSSRKMEHLKIETQRLKNLYSHELNTDPQLFKIGPYNAPAFPFGPSPIESLVAIDLSNSPLSVLGDLNTKKLSANTLKKYRYSFYVNFQIFLTNSPRGSDPGAILANIEEFNPTIFNLLNDHTDKEKPKDESISVKTLQKKSERYFKKIGMPSSKNGLFEIILDSE